MTISASQQAALESPVVRAVYFLELAFQSGTQYICTANINIEWGGHSWIGLGAIGAISAVEESDGLEAKSLNFTLSIANSSLLTLAVGPVEEYRGRSAKMYMCPMNENFQLVGEPGICWRGVMDTMAIGIDGEEGGIHLRCETAAFGLKRRPALRMNWAQQYQKLKAMGLSKEECEDNGFQYLNDLVSNPQTWLSKKFQSL